MKKTLIYLFAALVMVAAASCQKEDLPLQPQEEDLVDNYIIKCVFAANENDTKTTITGMTPMWSSGDQVLLYDRSDPSHEKNVTVGSGDAPLDPSRKFFTIVHPGGWSSDIVAIYPANAYAGQYYGSPMIGFSSQNGSFATANRCIAYTNGTTLSFVNQNAILYFPSKPENVREIVLPISAMTNNFTVSLDDGNSPHHMDMNYAMNSNVVNVGDGTGPVYIAVPSGSVPVGSTFIFRNADHEVVGWKTVNKSTGNTLNLNKIYDLKAIETNAGKPNVLPAYFTVNNSGSGKKVRFSKGNLKAYKSDGWKWGLYANQYDFNSINSSCVSGVRSAAAGDTEIDLFTWGYHSEKSINPIGDDNDNVSISSGNLNVTTQDWGSRIDVPGTWRTLTAEEWEYLFLRPGIEYRYAKAKLMGPDREGIIIFPDNFTKPDGVPLSVYNKIDAAWTSNEIPVSDWAKLEAAGAVFLPAAGKRAGTGVTFVGSKCYYWSSSLDSGVNAFHFEVNPDAVIPKTSVSADNGYAVRLVTEL